MANTSLYSELETRLDELRSNLLPDEFDPMSSYSIKDIDMTKGYLLLAHSEVEYFIESICHKFIELQVTRYCQSDTPTNCTLALLLYSKLDWMVSTEAIAVPGIQSSNLEDTVKTLLVKASKKFNEQVNGNHGVKAVNIRRLIAPTGLLAAIPEDEIESFDTFGSDRGNVAHVSTKHITAGLDPLAVLNKLKTNILPTLKSIDEKMLKLEPGLATVNWVDVKPGTLK